MTLGQLREIIKDLPDEIPLGAFIPNDSQGHSITRAYYNTREELVWFEVAAND